MRRVLRMVTLSALVCAVTGCAPFRAAREFALTADWQGFERVEVRSSNGGIEVRVVDRPDVHVYGTLTVQGDSPEDARRNLEDLEVVADVADDDAGTFRVQFHYADRLRRKSPGAQIVVEVPEACAAALHTQNGALRVHGLRGDVRLQTSNGRLEAHDISGALHAESTNGRIELRGVAGDTYAKTSNGSIQVTDLRGNLEARTSNGRIHAQVVPPADGYVKLHTTNGSIEVVLPADLPADLHLDASNGRIRAEVGELTLRGSRAHGKAWGINFDELEATINGGGCQVEAVTSNGSVTLACQ